MKNAMILRKELLKLLNVGNAHGNIFESLNTVPPKFYNSKIAGILYTPWQLVEHLRIAQKDILEFVINPKHNSPEWPEGYWPDRNELADEKKWNETVVKFKNDLDEVKKLTDQNDFNLKSEIPHASGYTYLREILLVADHNSYHIGQLNMMRKIFESR